MSTGRGIAALQMYDLPETRPAVGALWRAIADRVEGAPEEVTWDGVAATTWLDPDLVLGQACGWPLVTSLAGRVTVVGAFRYQLGEPTGTAGYRSVLIARDEVPLESFAGRVAAVNSWDSLSGWVSLAVAVEEVAGGTPFFGSVIQTGGHLASIDAVRSGAADIASIDAVSLALLRRERPRTLAGLATVGRGPLVPTLPLITAWPDATLLRSAIGEALIDPTIGSACKRLLIAGFTPVDESAYAGLLALDPIVRRAIPPPRPE